MSEKKEKEKRKIESDLKITNQELRRLMLSTGLQRFLDTRDLSPAIKFNLLLTMKKLEDILTALEKVRQEIIDRYAEKDTEGKRVVINNLVQFGENEKEANEKLNELMAEEITVPKGRLTVDLNKDIPKDLLSARDMLELSLLVDFKGIS